jgi:hypothetical protein
MANGQSVTFKWLVAVLITLVLGIGGHWVLTIESRLGSIENTHVSMTAHLATMDEKLNNLLEGQKELRAALTQHMNIVHNGVQRAN